MRLAFLAALAAVLIAAPAEVPVWGGSGGRAGAQDLAGDPGAGLAFARENCSDCHDVERESYDFAAFYGPPFIEIAAQPSVTELSLNVFFRTPHIDMPDFILSDTDRDNVVAWILSLKGAN